MTGWYYISDNDSGSVRQLDKTKEFYKINPFPIVTAEDMTTLNIEKNNFENTYLLIKFGTRGTELWRVATEKAVGKELVKLIMRDKNARRQQPATRWLQRARKANGQAVVL